MRTPIHAHGVAPVDCNNYSRADIAWVYKAQQSSQQWLHNAAAHELGHSCGLAHVVNVDDPMYWTNGDGDFSVTLGCASTPEPLFCPSEDLTRGQMVVFLRRALDLPTSPFDHFTDDDGRFYEAAANAAADTGITVGCGGDDFCGECSVTRAEMASFLAWAFSYPSSGTDHVSDDDDSIHEDAINRIADAGVTFPCGNGRYCPEAPVQRDQMASFLARALYL